VRTETEEEIHRKPTKINECREKVTFETTFRAEQMSTTDARILPTPIPEFLIFPSKLSLSLLDRSKISIYTPPPSFPLTSLRSLPLANASPSLPYDEKLNPTATKP
jgi:hypothetical protein